MKENKVTELWAVLDLDGNVMRSRGGSSTQKKLLVYESKKQAEKVLKSPWIKQIIPDRSKVQIVRVYEVAMSRFSSLKDVVEAYNINKKDNKWKEKKIM